MDQITIFDNSYIQWISQLSKRYRRSQIKAAVKVNSEVLRLNEFTPQLVEQIDNIDNDLITQQLVEQLGMDIFQF